MNKNDVFQVRIEDLSTEGLGIGKLDGFTWFVKDAVIGDMVEAAATKLKKNYGFARLVRVLDPSPARRIPPCSIARQCGGCQLQQMNYEAQLAFKEGKVFNNLLRLGGVDRTLLEGVCEPIVGMKDEFRYRNKAQFPIARDKKTGKIIAGFYAGRTHSVIPCEDCLLGVEENRIILKQIIQWMETHQIEPYDEEAHRGLVRHVLIRKGFQTGQLMVCLVINGEKLPHAETLKALLCQDKERQAHVGGEALMVDSLSYCINREKTNVIMGTEVVNLYGPGYIEDDIGAVHFRISPLSFFQVNPVQTEKLYGLAMEYANLTGNETVWDLYCGIGTISLFLAQKAKRVYGVEIIPQAIQDARQNAALNGFANTEFYVGAAEEVLPRWYAEHPEERIDVVCVDPPRKGCDEACLETIVGMQPDRIVYVSCDSATLARDVKYLQAHEYELKRVRAVDQFAETCHVETVVRLQRKHT